MTERRRNERIRAPQPGTVVSDGRGSALSCTVCDMSARGLRIATDRTALLPSLFDVVLPAKKVSFRARIRWRTAGAAGIEFLSPARPIAEPVDVSLRRRDMERGRAALRRRLAPAGRRDL